MFTENYHRQFPMFRDMQGYSWEYLEQLIQQANQVCGWNYQTKIRSIQDTVDLHKHIEVTLAQGFEHVPESWDNILHELHIALHKIQVGEMSTRPHRGVFLQIEWFNNHTEPLPEDFVFQQNCQFGSIRLQNAYVGHPPLKIFKDNDHSNVFQTCRFHDLIKPGLRIVTDNNALAVNLNDYKQWWHANAPDFVNHHGWDKIMYYTGHPIIGHVTNVSDLVQVNQHPSVLELQEVIIN